MSEAGQFAMFIASGAIGLSFMLGPIGQAIARRVGGKKAGLDTGEMAAERVAALEDRVQELEQAAARVAELEDRLDFTERLIAQLPPGSVGVERPTHGG